MGFTTQTPRASLKSATKFQITVVTTSITPLIETSITLPNATKKFTLRARDKQTIIRIGAASGDTAISANYFEIPRGNNWSEDLVDTSAKIFLATEKASVIVEVVSWQ